jgi:beta-N-acetylhexosaminidase
VDPTDVDRAAHTVLLASYDGRLVPAWLLGRVERGLGGVCLYGSNRLDADGTARAAVDLRAAGGGVLLALDEEGGDVTRLWADTGSPVPGNLALGTVDDPRSTTRVAAALGRVLLAAGVDLVLAPVADVNVDAQNPVIGVRSFGRDPQLVARHVAAAVEGFQSAGVAACAKHFPGHGATRADSHLAVPVVDAGRDVLEARELVPFRAAVDAGVAAVMTAHVVVPALDPSPATYAHAIVHDLLRGELGFAGAVITDALDMAGAGGGDAIPGNVVRALAAGSDLCCVGPDGTEELVAACVAAVVRAVAAGELAEARLLDAAARVRSIRPPQPTDARSNRADLDELGLHTARRAVRVEGEVAEPTRGAHVIELDRPPMIAAGNVRWGLGGALATADPSAIVVRVDPDVIDAAGTADLLDAAAGHPLVVVTRDPGRSPAQAAVLDGLVTARPDAVVVDMGWPDPATPRGRTRIVTYGASAASARAAAEVLVDGAAQPVTVPVERAAGG